MTPYDEDGQIVRDPGYHPEGGESLTKQADALETDVNKIIGRYIATGVAPPLNGRTAVYGDFSASVDFHTAANQVQAAWAEFMNLPIAVREACDNDPGRFLDLVYDDQARAELVKLGLETEQIPEPAQEPKAPAPVVPESPAPVETPAPTVDPT